MVLSASEGAIPIKTTVGSRSAEEKRKKNAGASSRFRRRRKEREKEMSEKIIDLEERLKNVEDERDYYRDIVLRLQQQQQHSGRPPAKEMFQMPSL